MKSGLRDRNNPVLQARRGDVVFQVSMKSGLRDRNIEEPLPAVAPEDPVSMKSGLKDRNNQGR